MFEAMGAYIKNIALIMLITIFTEQLLPDAKIKKYISVIAGIVMMFAVVGGIRDLFINVGSERIISIFNSTDKLLTSNEYVELNSLESNDFNVHMERIRPYNKDTKGEVEK